MAVVRLGLSQEPELVTSQDKCSRPGLVRLSRRTRKCKYLFQSESEFLQNMNSNHEINSLTKTIFTKQTFINIKLL